jgi:hypothetical protein
MTKHECRMPDVSCGHLTLALADALNVVEQVLN